MLTPDAQHYLERLDTIGRCWAAVTDLMIPEHDLHAVDRNGLACLFRFLSDESDKAWRGFTETQRTR